MTRSTWWLLALAGLVACGGEDDWRVRPPGGNDVDARPPSDARIDAELDAAELDAAPIDALIVDGPDPDAREIDAIGPDAADPDFDGLICPIDDLRMPDLCPARPERAGVAVHLAGSPVSATSGMFGRYVLQGVGTVAIEAGDGSSAVRPSTSTTTLDGSLVHTPVLLNTYWTLLTAALAVSPADTSGTVALYLTEGDAPLVGATVDQVAGSFEPAYYDDGGRLTWHTTDGTGAAGVVLLFDVPPGTYTLAGTTSDARPITVPGVAVRARAVTFVHASL